MSRVALVLALAAGFAAMSGAAAADSGHVMVKPEELQWKSVPSLPAGAQIAVLEGDLAKDEAFTMRVKFPANFIVPLHTHPTLERVTVLEGTLHLGIGETFEREKAEALGEGALAIMDAGVPMYGFTGDQPTVIQVNGVGPWGIDYLNPEDDPRQKSN
jgi:quercetin dioxygenase-like cupin family protein